MTRRRSSPYRSGGITGAKREQTRPAPVDLNRNPPGLAVRMKKPRQLLGNDHYVAIAARTLYLAGYDPANKWVWALALIYVLKGKPPDWSMRAEQKPDGSGLLIAPLGHPCWEEEQWQEDSPIVTDLLGGP